MPILLLILKAISILYMNLCYMINDAIAKEKEKQSILPLTIQYDHTVGAAQRYKHRQRIQEEEQHLQEIVITV